MERAVFLLENDNSRIPCLLNPESLTIQRTAGIRLRSSSSGPVALAGNSYDPLLYTDGGRTELALDLLFDVSLVSGTAPASTPDSVQTSTPEDVRELTQPLMALAESTPSDTPEKPAALVRFLWGKAWNVRGVVIAAAERLEYFTDAGVPRRSWLRMRFVMVREPDSAEAQDLDSSEQSPVTLDPDQEVDLDELQTHRTLGDGQSSEGDGASSERLDELSSRYYGDPTLWRLIAEFNDIDDPLEHLAGRILHIPPRTAAGGLS